ncbi:MAG TPA: hypothetical protein VGD05_06245 [Pyrinomonadaceae bacterium]|jgi:predicted DNA-binding protein
MKTKRINVRVSEKEKAALATVSERLDISEATIVREAIQEKITELAKKIEQKAKANLALQI